MLFRSRQSPRTYLLLTAQTPRHPLGEISNLIPDDSEGRQSVASACTLSRGGFEVISPLFWSSELPRDFTRPVKPVIRSLLQSSVMGRGCRKYPRLAQELLSTNRMPTLAFSLPVHDKSGVCSQKFRLTRKLGNSLEGLQRELSKSTPSSAKSPSTTRCYAMLPEGYPARVAEISGSFI